MYNVVKNYNKFQNVNYSYDKILENYNESDITLKYDDDFVDFEIKSPELKKFREDIDITKINNSSKIIH
jgi:hypothetical protein